MGSLYSAEHILSTDIDYFFIEFIFGPRPKIIKNLSSTHMNIIQYNIERKICFYLLDIYYVYLVQIINRLSWRVSYLKCRVKEKEV